VRERLSYIDGLRGLAALMVFMIHCGSPAIRSLGKYGNLLVDHGRYGVSVFFVVSAYALCLSVAPAFDGEATSWTAYFIRRFFRIAPLYWLVLAFVLVFGLSVTQHDSIVPSVLAHFSFANMFLPQYGNDLIGVEWSIAVEFAFYILLPFLVLMCRQPVGVLAIVGLIITSLLYKLRMLEWLGEPFWSNRNFSLLSHIEPFTIGILTFLAAKQGLISAGTKLPLFLMCACLLFVTAKLGEGTWSETMVSLITALAIANCTSSGMTRSALSFWPVVMIGKISYSIYLTHFIILDYFHFPIPLGPNQVVLAQLFVTLAISFVLYFAVEQPARRVGSRLAAAVERTRQQRLSTEPIAAASP
jgi:peptidoglycan/LPS O-acetylase OafA/YrhL